MVQDMVVDRFFVWVSDATVEQRLRAVGPLVRAWVEAADREGDRETLEAALTVVCDDADVRVRIALAETLSECDDAPRHLLLGLLWDDPRVAEIVAERCEALIEAEWIEAASSGGDDVRFALACRRRVGVGLASALAETIDRRGAVALLANGGADIPAAALLRLVDRFGEFADVRQALVGRAHVPVTVRHRVLEKLAETMTNLIVLGRRGGERGEAAARDAKDRATVALSSTATDAEVAVLVDHLRHTGQLTTRLMLRAVCVGDLRLVEEALAALAEVPVRRVGALVADGREGPFRALYGKAGMPERAFPAFASALEVHRELVRETGGWDGRPGDRARFSRRLVERVLTRIGAIPRRDADDLVAMLRRFSADAAREQARAVVVERTRIATQALAAPSVEAIDEDETCFDVAPLLDAAEGVTAPTIAIDAPLDRLAVYGPAFSVDIEEEIAGAVGPAVAAARAHPVPDELDEPIGLFSHVRLDDIPPEWLADDGTIGDGDAVVGFDAAFARALRGELAA